MQNQSLRNFVNTSGVSDTSSSNQDLLARKVATRTSRTDKAALRRHKRFPCSAVGILTIMNRSISMEGIVSEVSRSGVKFRPATVFMLDRTGTSVSVAFDEFQVSGKVAATRSDGYGIALFDEVDEAMLRDFLLRQRAASKRG